MFRRNRFLSFPMVIGAVVIGVVSGKAIFGPPLDQYWKDKLEREDVIIAKEPIEKKSD
ncbi:unnamed protein product [Cochlearia groenlandica]